MKADGLISYWISFPDDYEFPHGLGITAWSIQDAYALLDSNGYSWHRRAKTVKILEAVAPHELPEKWVARYCGPHVCRGIWYPPLNIGFGAPTGR